MSIQFPTMKDAEQFFREIGWLPPQEVRAAAENFAVAIAEKLGMQVTRNEAGNVNITNPGIGATAPVEPENVQAEPTEVVQPTPKPENVEKPGRKSRAEKEKAKTPAADVQSEPAKPGDTFAEEVAALEKPLDDAKVAGKKSPFDAEPAPGSDKHEPTRIVLRALASAKSLPVCSALLKSFGVAKANLLAEGDFAEFKRVAKVLAETSMPMIAVRNEATGKDEQTVDEPKLLALIAELRGK